MNDSPEVSVVMSVYNGAEHLAETLDSVLGQQGCDFEFIVIDDGSTDASGRILDDYAARDPRLRVLHQENTGLTRALIRGCGLARGEFIARQDAGDVSLPGRLAAQVAFIRSPPQAVMVASAVQFCGPQFEPLHAQVILGEELQSGLSQEMLELLRGPPHHGATLFRRAAYLAVGGYRAEFPVAQDLDLWLRLAESGTCLGMEKILYLARLEMGSISSRRRKEQFSSARLALDCRQSRAAGRSEADLFASVGSTDRARPALSPRERARFHYFVARCLAPSNRAAARTYYRQAFRDNPFHLKALIHWIAAR